MKNGDLLLIAYRLSILREAVERRNKLARNLKSQLANTAGKGEG